MTRDSDAVHRGLMRFRRLKLSGFKSFVEPTEMLIEPGLTGVVGPNGCGKSNLLEAIRWVMGESSARQMRGGGMEDVIFAGTARRAARDFAEVTLSALVDPPGPHGSELEVARRIERGAGSLYRINGRDVRARDVALVFADAATGAQSPALVSQGRIAAVIAARPTERRAMLEEAAGIAGLHVRRKEAETRLRATEANLARLDDMLAGLDTRIASLARQARAAERYKVVSDRIRLAEARLVFARWRDAANAADAAARAAKSAEADVVAAAAAAEIAETAQHDAGAALATARDAVWTCRQEATANAERLASLRAQLDAARARLADADRQVARLDKDRADAERLLAEAAAARARIEPELAKAEAALADEEACRPDARSARDHAEQDARAAELALAAATAEQATNEAEWRVAGAACDAARNRLARLDGETARLATRRAALAAEPDPVAAIAAATTRRDDAQTVRAAHEQRRTSLSAQVEALTGEREVAALALATTRADLAGIEREADALARDKAARDKAAAAKGRGPGALSASRAAPGYERALAAVLGRDASAPLGPAPAGVDGRFWTGAEVPQPHPDALIHHIPQAPDGLRARLALVRVADADTGQALAPGEWLVTRTGHLRRWDGFVARGEGAAEAAWLEAENRRAELEARLPAVRAAYANAEQAHERVRETLAGERAALTACERDMAATADAERSALRALDAAEAAARARAGRAAEIDRAEEDITAQRAIAAEELANALARQAGLPDPAAGRARLDAARGRDSAARAALLSTSAALSAIDQALAVGRERLTNRRNDLRNWQSRAGDAEVRLAGFAARADDLATERAILAAKPAGLENEIATIAASADAARMALTAAEAGLAACEQAARGAERALAQAAETLATARESRAGLAARAQSEDQRRQEMAAISGERFHCPPPLLPQRLGFASAEVATASAESGAHDKFIAERDRIGPVNLVAADELAEAETTLATTIAERAELTEAVNRLRGSIGSLNREGRERLRAAFTAVDGHFRRLFARLFGGGEAHLALIDSDDPLEAGLEIFAQPPGKRLQSLTLLSGGEQALTALALIFALFLTNPSPICVLDEVDAPLDDANVERFCDMLDAMAQDTATRYLIVTHNAVTMSRMHRLFGVTMVEQGVSRLVSVDLGGAEALLANTL